MTISEILSATELNSSKINSTLTIMEVNGIIENKLNRQYRLII
jgi:DNA-binding IclR family transcriptional regulator